VKALSIAAQTGTPVIIWGPPGAGKTSFVNAFGRALNCQVEVVIASIRDPSDFGGLPYLTSGGVELHAPSWAKRLVEANGGLLFLDEASTATPATQASMLRVILDKVVGDTILPPRTMVVAAANPPEQAAGGWDLSAPLANRFVHLEWRVSSADWLDGMLRGWADPEIPRLPEQWETQIPPARALVAGFIQTAPHKLLAVPNNEAAAGRAWPSPRSWDMAARQMAAAKAINAGDDLALELVCGCVGSGMATEFFTWKRDLDLPDPEVLLADPSKFVLPRRGDQIFAVLGAVVSAAVLKLDHKRWIAAWDILAAASDQGATDIAAAASKSLLQSWRNDLPLPSKQIKPFIPLLKTAGMIAG
jgi:hypothetical protein